MNGFSWTRVFAVLAKEFVQLTRDPVDTRRPRGPGVHRRGNPPAAPTPKEPPCPTS